MYIYHYVVLCKAANRIMDGTIVMDEKIANELDYQIAKRKIRARAREREFGSIIEMRSFSYLGAV